MPRREEDLAVKQALGNLGAQGPAPGAAPPPGGPMPGGPMPGELPPGAPAPGGELIICPNCGHEFPY